MSTLSAQRSRAGARLPRLVRRPLAPLVVLGAGIAYASWYLVIHSGAGLTFYYDEWAFLLRRSGHSLGVFLRPHNEHLSAIPIAIYKAMLEVFGLGDYRPYQWLLMGFVVALAVVVYVYARARVGAWLALVPALVVLLGGSFWEDTMWAFQIGFVGSTVCGVGALMAIDRGGRRGDALASLLLVLAIAQSSIGLPFLAGVTVELAIRVQWRRLWLVAVPVAAYIAWKLAYPVSDVKLSNLRHTPAFVFNAAAGASGSIFGLGRDPGKLILLALLALLAEACLRRRVNARFWGLLATALAFWVAAGLARAELSAPDASRYLLPGAVLIMLAAAEALRGARVPRAWLLVVCALLPVSVALGHDRFHSQATLLYLWAPDVRADVTALDAIEGRLRIDPYQWRVDPLRAPDMTAASYYDSASRYGRAGEPLAKLAQEPPEARGLADAVVLHGTATLPVASQPPPASATTPGVIKSSGAAISTDAGCVVATTHNGRPGSVEVAVAAAGIRYRSSAARASVGLRRFGDLATPVGTVPAARWQALRPPAIAAPGDWYAGFTLAAGTRLRVCGP